LEDTPFFEVLAPAHLEVKDKNDSPESFHYSRQFIFIIASKKVTFSSSHLLVFFTNKNDGVIVIIFYMATLFATTT